MAETRWDKLAKDLAECGFEVRVDEQPYTESRNARIVHGVSRSITYRVKGKGLVTIDDAYHRYTESWVGYRVTAEGLDSIIIGTPSRATKSRSETVAMFRLALANVEG